MPFNPWLNRWFEGDQPVLSAPAPLVAVTRSSVELVSDEVNNGQRLVRLRVDTPAEVLDGQPIFAAPGGIRDMFVNGENLKLKGAQPSVQVNRYGRWQSGMLVEIALPEESSLSVVARTAHTGSLRQVGCRDLPSTCHRPTTSQPTRRWP